MAIVRMTAEQAWAAGKADLDQIDATTEDDIRRHMIEDGFDADEPFEGLVPVVDPAKLRQRLNLSQDDFANHLSVPVDTIRGWEGGLSVSDPAVRALLRLIAADPERAFAVLAA